MPHRVLLTGANGFIAQHILAQFLEAGHSVRAVVRSQSSADQLKATFAAYPSPQVDFALVPDIAAPGAFDTALVSDPPFDLVLHTASPFNFRAGKSNKDFIDPAVKGTPRSCTVCCARGNPSSASSSRAPWPPSSTAPRRP